MRSNDRFGFNTFATDIRCRGVIYHVPNQRRVHCVLIRHDCLYGNQYFGVCSDPSKTAVICREVCPSWARLSEFVSSAIIIVHKAIVSAAMNKRQRVKRLIVSIALPFSVLKLKYLVIIFCVVSILFRYVGNALATEQGVGKEKNHDIADERHDEW